ncbi:uncharacterized protein LOC127749042 [Frankliniella occidentalis]|uniref:Uncharacterized protein LOC127749042 n=1 Tax=Frankliniella occidentalis TaxID=133901 RepID=A0A9C6WWD1_FRAOC|nr:uncharacterized protein LOC127749042 [Frankliniella occidentalis]
MKREISALTHQLREALNSREAIEKEYIASEAAKRALEAAVGKSTKVVSGKLPAFWSDKPSVWFAQAESHFATQNILQDATKYHYVVGQLDTATASEVEDIITGPMGGRTYANLKENLISRLSDSEQKRVRKLILEEEMGDRKPSQFLRHLRSLAGSSAAVSDALLSQIWLQRLPSTASAILSSHANLDLNALATMADKIVEVAPPPSAAVLAIKNNPAPEVNTVLLEKMDKMERLIASLMTSPDRRDDRQPRSRSRSHSGSTTSRSRSQNNFRSNNSPARDAECWYHSRYGDDARKCVAPCAYKGNANGNLP